jgi:hypothetical protein
MESSRPLSASFPPAATGAPVAKGGADAARGIVDRTAAERAVPSPATSLWDILTPEEQEVFERSASMGPLVYRCDGRPAAEVAVPTGRRIDLRG